MENTAGRMGFLLYLLIGIGLGAVGLLAVNHIVNTFWPIDVERLDLVRAVAVDRASSTQLLKSANLEIVFSFLAALVVSLTGLSLPVVYFLNKRFGQKDGASFFVILRQAMWVAIWAAFCLWLQMNRSMGLGLILLVASVFVVLEVMLQVRTKAADLAA